MCVCAMVVGGVDHSIYSTTHVHVLHIGTAQPPFAHTCFESAKIPSPADFDVEDLPK